MQLPSPDHQSASALLRVGENPKGESYTATGALLFTRRAWPPFHVNGEFDERPEERNLRCFKRWGPRESH